VRLRIVSDGNPRGTRVENVETGEALERVRSVRWKADVNGGPAIAVIECMSIHVDVIGDAEGFESVEVERRPEPPSHL
jgi:hypothetical protein